MNKVHQITGRSIRVLVVTGTALLALATVLIAAISGSGTTLTADQPEAVPVPTPPPAEIQPSVLATTDFSGEAFRQQPEAVPVPTPPPDTHLLLAAATPPPAVPNALLQTGTQEEYEWRMTAAQVASLVKTVIICAAGLILICPIMWLRFMPGFHTPTFSR